MNCNWRLGLLGLFIAGTISLARPQPNPGVTQPADDLAQGKLLYIGHCAPCHGIEGVGGRGPALNQQTMRHVTDEASLFRVIKSGIPGGEMPGAWQLTDREIRLVAGYVRSLGRIAVTKLAGDPAKGKAIYEKNGGCAVCHIIRGGGGNLGPDLSAVGTRRSPAYLREALLDPGAASPDGYLVVTITDRDDSKVRGIRANEDSFTIQLRDANNRFHSFRKREIKDLKKEVGVSTMPSYKTTLTNAEIDDLVAYLASLRGEK
jgi:putative heme-binding domain-containing protein